MDSLFYKVFHNKYLFNYILSSINNEILEFKSISSYRIYNRIKFKNIRHLKWFFVYNQTNLLKDKLKYNQFISLDKESVKIFLKNTKEDLEFIKLFYSSQKKLLEDYNLVDDAISEENLVALKYFIQDCGMEINRKSILHSLKFSNTDIVDYLLNYCYNSSRDIKDVITFINKFNGSGCGGGGDIDSGKYSFGGNRYFKFDNTILEKSLNYSSNNIKYNMIKHILDNHKEIYSKSRLSVGNSYSWDENQVAFSVYSKLPLSHKKVLIELNRVEPLTAKDGKIETLKGLSNEQLEFFIKVEYLKFYNTQHYNHQLHLERENDINNFIESLTKIEDEQERIKEIKKFIVLELESKSLIFEYLLEYKDGSFVNEESNCQVLEAYATYTMKFFDIDGLLLFIKNSSTISITYQDFYAPRSEIKQYNTHFINEEFFFINSISKNPDLKKKFIEFFKIYYSQDIFREFEFYHLIQYLILSPSDLVEVHVLNSLKVIPGFPLKYFRVLDPQLIQSIDKLIWYNELCIEYSIGKVKFHQLDNTSIYSKDFIEFLYNNKSTIPNSSPRFKFESLDLALYLKSKFEDKYPISSIISTDLLLKVVANGDLDSLKTINGFQVNFKLFNSIMEPLNIENSVTSAIEMYNYFDVRCFNIDNNLFYLIIISLLHKIFEDNDNNNNNGSGYNIESGNNKEVKIKKYDFNLFRDTSYDILICNIINLNVKIVEYLLESLLESNNIQDLLNQFQLYSDKKYKGNYSKLLHKKYEALNFSFNKVVKVIKLLLEKIPCSNYQQFNSIFNLLFKMLLLSNCNINEAKEIKDLLLESSITLSINSFHIFCYLNIKSNKFSLYFRDIFQLPIPIYTQMKNKLYEDKYVTTLDSTFTQDCLDLEFISNNTFKTIYQVVSDLIHNSILPTLINDCFDQINYLVWIGAYDIISEFVESNKNTPNLILHKQYPSLSYKAISSISNFQLLKSFIEIPMFRNYFLTKPTSNLDIKEYITLEYPDAKFNIKS